MRTPRCSSTSADPQRELIERLPCFATCTPAPATTNAAAVETLNVPEASPPVPQVSTSASIATGRLPGENRRGVAAHGRGETDQLVHRLALHAQRGEQSRDLRVVRVARKNLLHRGFRFHARQVLFRHDFFERFVDHM